MTEAWAEEQVPGAVVQAARDAAQRVVRALKRSEGGTIASAESLTSGLVASALAEVPGVSEWFLGGVVAYSFDVKSGLLGVDRDLLERLGAVNETVAVQMARGACENLGARWAVATTGVAGPGPAEGKPEGTVWLAAVDAKSGDVLTRCISVEGTRDGVRWAASGAALELLARCVEQNLGT
ncbi:MAG TPA: CinA family protein [Actinomycetaceae bacterium]|nr:CinA family protein [Actinomycetaceae bacterium]